MRCPHTSPGSRRLPARPVPLPPSWDLCPPPRAPCAARRHLGHPHRAQEGETERVTRRQTQPRLSTEEKPPGLTFCSGTEAAPRSFLAEAELRFFRENLPP